MARFTSLVLTALGLLAVLGMPPSRAGEPDYPSDEELRRLQLDTITCGRDNLEADCSQARAAADPLMDHPKLSGACKDALWQIGQDAVVAPQNSFQRRDGLTEVASRVVRLCRPLDQPIRSSGGSGQPQPPPGRGFGLIR